MLDGDGRRAWAFLAILGGCIVMTVFAAVGVWLVSGNAEYSFYLALAAHAQIALGLTALAAQFVKRTIKAGKDGIEISDSIVAAQYVADEAQHAADEVKA